MQEKKRILFVDDDAFYAIGYHENLEKVYDVDKCTTAAQAELELRTPKRFVCAVIDVMMPVPDGWPVPYKRMAKDGILTGIVLLKRCKTRIVDAALRVIVLTNRHKDEIENEVTALGFPDGLVVVYHKPATDARMLPKIVHAIAGKKP